MDLVQEMLEELRLLPVAMLPDLHSQVSKRIAYVNGVIQKLQQMCTSWRSACACLAAGLNNLGSDHVHVWIDPLCETRAVSVLLEKLLSVRSSQVSWPA
jgi:hypothetical protein